MNKVIQIAQPAIDEEEWHALRAPLSRGWLTQGPEVAAFEEAFARQVGAKHALATTSCTTGLHLILSALGIGPGDEVIVPAFSWVATANAVVYCGATPVFVDVNLSSFNVDAEQVKTKVTKNTKAVIAVHLFGMCADIDVLRSVLPSDVPIIEDAACAAGAKYKGRSAGVLGLAAAFSFHPRKSITTGEGGMVTTNDEILAKKIDVLRNHGASVSEEQRHSGPRPYILPDFEVLGYNYRMTDLQGAIGRVQLKKLDNFIRERGVIADRYIEAFRDLDWLLTPKPLGDGSLHAWQAFVLYVDPDNSPINRNSLMEILQKKGISTRPGTHAIHMLGFYKNNYGINIDDFPNARDCDAGTMAIPLHNVMDKDDCSRVIDAIRGAW